MYHTTLHGRGRSAGRLVPVLSLALALAGAAAPAARAFDGPLLPHLVGVAFLPTPMTSGTPIELLLSGDFPYACGEAVDASVTDSAHVAVTIRPAATCADSMPPTWVQSFSLGALVAGRHLVTVRFTVQQPGQPDDVREATVPFDVINVVAPPAAPFDTASFVFHGVEITPPSPTTADPITMTVGGRMPFSCGGVVDAHMVDADHAALTLAPAGGCTDTSSAWSATFALGTRSAGQHFIAVDVTVAYPDTPYVVHGGAGIFVLDPGAPPPPPPGDSLQATLSDSHPNPFREATAFSVSLDSETSVQVAVYDLSGRRVALVHQGALPRGTTTLRWNGRDDRGARVRGGLYFYRLVTPGRVVTRRVVVLASP